MDGVSAQPGPGRVRPLAAESRHQAHGALAPGLDERARRLGQDGGIGLEQLGSFAEQALDAVVTGRHFLALVEHVGHRHRRTFDRARQLDEDSDARLHVRRADAP